MTRIIAAGALSLTSAWAVAGDLPEVFVTEVTTDFGGIYTITINQPPSPPGSTWLVSAWAVPNTDASFVETDRVGWAGELIDAASWNAGRVFETGTPGEPIFLFESGMNGVGDLDSVFEPGTPSVAVYWNDSYFGNPLVATSSNFTWSTSFRRPSAGVAPGMALITSGADQYLLCRIAFGASAPLDCTPVVAADADGDSVPDSMDNCTLIPNPGQEDTNFDGYGNACDPDLNDDGIVNIADLGQLRSVFFTSDEDADFNSDGTVSVVDLGIMRSFFFQSPGPSAGF